MTPGTLCRIIDADCLTDKTLIGRECEVVGESAHVLARLSKALGHRIVYVRIPLIGTIPMCETCLEPKRPPVGDWSVIAAKTGWNPMRAHA